MVQIHLGLVQEAVGKSADARAQLEKGLGMLREDQEGPSITLAREALARLDAPAAEPADPANATDPAETPEN